MAENKRQHYVPKFYLKCFSNNRDNRSVGIFNLKAEKFVRDGNLENQAFGDYFYGEDLQVEKALAEVEAKASAFLSEVKKYRHLSKNCLEDYIVLLFFIFLQMTRTKYSAEVVNEMGDKLFKQIYSHDKKISEMLKKVKIVNEKPALFALGSTAQYFSVLFDLKCKIIVNLTDSCFITSDNPVVKYNQFLLKRKWPLGKTGLAQIGLEIFFPIGPKEILIFYDDKIYFVGHNKKDIVYLGRKQDVNELNSLQYLNSLDNLYFNERITESYLGKIINTNAKYKHSQKVDVEELQAISRDGLDNSSLIVVQTEEISKSVNLSFVNERKYAKEYILGPSASLIRNKQLLQYAEEFAKHNLLNKTIDETSK